ncbi:vacuolar protein sorting-associated protein 41 [Monosporozyma servazzii]
MSEDNIKHDIPNNEKSAPDLKTPTSQNDLKYANYDHSQNSSPGSLEATATGDLNSDKFKNTGFEAIIHGSSNMNDDRTSTEEEPIHNSINTEIKGDTLQNDQNFNHDEEDEGTDAEETDTEETDAEGTDAEETDTEETDAEGTDAENEDENPPLLKYTRITSKLPKSFFQRDTISCCNFNENTFFFGTHAGILHITTTEFESIQTLKCHRSSILSIYCDGTNFASASMDGTVIIGSLENPSQLTAFDFKRPVHAVVLDDDYTNNKLFVSGGMAGRVILSQRNWLGNRTDITLSKGRGSILGIYKLENTLFWFNDDGITFVDSVTRSQLLHLPYPSSTNDSTHGRNNSDMSRPDLFKPHVNFPESDRIIIGWGCNIWSLKVSLIQKSAQEVSHIGSILSSAASSLRGTPDKQVELEHHFTVDMIIAGVASFKDDQLMCLGYNRGGKDQIQLKAAIPELRIFDIVTGEEINSDEVIVKNYERLTIHDYHLGKFIYSDSIPQYYLVSASDCISIHELSLNDHYEWFLKHDKLLRAWEIAQFIPSIQPKDRLTVGTNYLLDEINRSHWNEIGSNMEKVFTTARKDIPEDTDFQQFINDQWQALIFKVLNAKKITRNLIDSLPQDHSLDSLIFDTVLEDQLQNKDFNEFCRLIHTWDINCFSTSLFEERLEGELKHLSNDNSKRYREQLIYLYLRTGKYSKAISHMLIDHDKRALDTLIESPHLIPEFQNSLLEILLLPYTGDLSRVENLPRDELCTVFTRSIQLSVVAVKYISLEKLVNLFKKNEEGINISKLLLLVLENISKSEPQLMRSQENEMVRLYTKYDRIKLLPFLKEKRDYDVNKAILICQAESGLYKELIYLWGRIGEAKKALKIIIDELDNPKMAIDYVISWKDDELWDFMIPYTIDRPEYIRLLLKNSDILGERYMSVITGIHNDIKLSDIKEAINDTLNSKSLSLEVVQNMLQLVDDESLHIAKEYLKLSEKGKYFDIDETR